MPDFQFDQIKILVTSECNLNCAHCFRSVGRGTQKLSKEKLFEIIDFAAANGTNKLSFSGGEFFTHSAAYDVLDYCLRKDIPCTVLTNAIDIDRSYFRLVEKKNMISFQISIDGCREKHDRRRGEGSYDRTIENACFLSDSGFSTTGSMVVDVSNYRDIVDVLKMQCFSSVNFLPVAATDEHNTKLCEASPEVRREYEETVRYLYTREKHHLGKEYRCHMFPHGLGIRYDGNVYPCAVARDYDLFCMGNINDTSLDSVLRGFVSSEAYGILGKYTSNDIGACNGCKAESECNRGCRIRAYKFFHELLKPDPFCCYLYQVDFTDSDLNRLFWGC